MTSGLHLAPEIHNGIQEDILIAISITLGIQHLSNDVCSMLFGATIEEMYFIDMSVQSELCVQGANQGTGGANS